MKLFGLALMALTASAMADKIPEENGVLVLSEKNYQKAIDDNEFILVEFYAPWCGHCKSLAPEYEKAAQKLAKSGSKIKLAKVDAIEEKKLAEEHQVQGFPTLKFYKSGKAKDYNGPREADGIVDWLNKKTGPPAEELNDVAKAKQLVEENDIVVIGFFKKPTGKEAKQFIKVADDADDIPFYISSNDDVFKNFEVKDESKVIMFRKFDEPRVVYDGKIVSKQLEKWVSESSVALVTEFSPETAPKLFSQKVKAHFLFFAEKKAKNTKEQLDTLNPVASKFKGEVIFVFVDTAKEDNGQVLEFFGLTTDDTPQYCIYEMEKSAKFLSGKKQVKEAEVSKFVQDYLDGNLKRTLKSEDLPKDWDAKPVKVLVSSNFKKVALDKSKDVFVEFYAPWCGHCKQLAPKWDELGEKFANHDSIVIAKMDSTANEIEEVQVDGFPTLKLFKKDTNEIVDYNGKREVADMVKFLETGKQEAASDSGDEESEDYEDDSSDEESDSDSGMDPDEPVIKAEGKEHIEL